MKICKGVSGPKKNPCPDCHFCQWCADTRCSVCRSPENCKNHKKKKPAAKQKSKARKKVTA